MLWPRGVDTETARDIPGQIRCGTGAGWELQAVALEVSDDAYLLSE